MNNQETIARYLQKTLSDNLDIPVYNDLQENSDSTYCVYFILDGTPIKYVANNTAWTEFDVRINIWSNEFKYTVLDSIIGLLDGVQGVTVENGTDSGYIQSIQYNRQSNIHTPDTPEWYGVQAEFLIRAK